jgi:hypothetical protein
METDTSMLRNDLGHDAGELQMGRTVTAGMAWLQIVNEIASFACGCKT